MISTTPLSPLSDIVYQGSDDGSRMQVLDLSLRWSCDTVRWGEYWQIMDCMWHQGTITGSDRFSSMERALTWPVNKI
ncbi:hypothetical protein CY34DRAFT_807664 [Suillus luteus UH-Slu-Lm8-n1]|uniref:Unplaced genomic scaffold CY34scaffold_189, whole genome shotgun sequence n=1 Tax=Suillus luteus UH-Slu-Lm8-n1 TaxID=930992 RepID=A0A0D0APV3_9AGAM|nr:hypothetical protein CY34DRAFT_807664 [Suillus luteus UH-Slu-Lm8-n1]